MEKIKDVLLDKIAKSERIILVPHKNADLDAISSAIALSEIISFIGKKGTIIIDDDISKIDQGVRLIIEETKGKYNYLKGKDLLPEENTLYIFTDVNGISRTNLPNNWQDANHETIIIDHHFPSFDMVSTPYSFINVEVSSASEILVKILAQLKIKIDPNVAKYLLAGIYLDTNKLTKNITSSTMTNVVKLLKSGAEIADVNKYFAESFSSDRKVQQIIDSAEFHLLNIAIAEGNVDTEYTCEEIAKAADYLLKFDTDASFAIGNIGNSTVAISGRSNSKVDISKVMKELGGGGNIQSGAAHIENTTGAEVHKKLIRILKPEYINK